MTAQVEQTESRSLDWPLIAFFVLAYAIAWFILLSFGFSFIFTWLFNGSGESLIPGLLFHATQNWEERFETLFPGLAGTDWELISTLGMLVIGIIAGVVVWRQGRGKEHD